VINMAKGDTKADMQQVLAGEFLEIRPPAGEEWSIHNIYFEDSIEVYRSNGTYDLKFHPETSAGFLAKHTFHVTNGQFIKVKNPTAIARYIAYDGMQTK